MKLNRVLFFTTALTALGASQSSMADTITQCESLARPAGYLTVQANIQSGGCPTRYVKRYSTPETGLAIIDPTELLTVSPRYVVTRVNKIGPVDAQFIITELTDNLIACTMPDIIAYNFFTESNGIAGVCRYNEPSGTPNSVRFLQRMYVEIAKPAGSPGQLRVSLNSRNPNAVNYVVRITSELNGGSRTIMKSGNTKSAVFLLRDLAPELIADAQAGANFTFEVELFQGVASVSKYSVKATGKEMLMN